MRKPIQVSAATMEYVKLMIDASHRAGIDLQLTGAEVTQGAAVFAGMIAKCNATAGFEEMVGMVSAEIVMQLSRGRDPVIH